MPFASYEQSTYSGQPVQLYEFLRSSGGVDYYWRYCTADRDLTYLGALYKATAISDEGVKLSGEAAASEFKITLPVFEQFCIDFRLGGAPPSDTIFVRVYRCHAVDISGLDTDDPVVGIANLMWVGTVDGLTQVGDIEATITCSMLATSFKRGGLRYAYIRNCPHVLYAPLTCKADKAGFRADTYLTSVTNNKIVSPDFALFADGWFDGGYIEYVVWPSNYLERRMVTRHAGDTLVLLGTVGGLRVGDLVTAYAGCARTVRACIDKFGNYDNYGGFPHLPGRNPYDGNPVF